MNEGMPKREGKAHENESFTFDIFFHFLIEALCGIFSLSKDIFL
jgi:hypothetical protein